MTFSAANSMLTGPLFSSAAMRDVFADAARVAAMLRAEAALADAHARRGEAPPALAAAIRKIRPAELDLAAIGAATAEAGVPVIPFVKAVEERLPEKLRAHFHHGATSQDILDTALALQVASGLELIASDIHAILTGLSALARRHRKTPQIGRTLGQHAAPITFGATVANWIDGISAAATDFAAVRDRVAVVSLGGPVGTLAALGDAAAATVEDFARILGLAPAPAGHTSRWRIAALGAWLTMLIGVLAKIATDVVFLSATEVGEVREASGAGRGGSSAMPHKQNPVSAMVILAAHGAAGGHLATLTQAMAAGQQRPAGAWQSEWHALPMLFALASGALREGRRIAETLVVDDARMRGNIDLTRGLVFSDSVSAVLSRALGRIRAGAIVSDAAEAARAGERSFAEGLAGDSRIPSSLKSAVADAFDLAPAVAASARVADRAIASAKTAAKKLGGAK